MDIEVPLAHLRLYISNDFDKETTTRMLRLFVKVSGCRDDVKDSCYKLIDLIGRIKELNRLYVYNIAQAAILGDRILTLEETEDVTELINLGVEIEIDDTILFEDNRIDTLLERLQKFKGLTYSINKTHTDDGEDECCSCDAVPSLVIDNPPKVPEGYIEQAKQKHLKNLYAELTRVRTVYNSAKVELASLKMPENLL
jgi:hypothetical protein